MGPVAQSGPAMDGNKAEPLFRSVPFRPMVIVSAIGPGAEEALIPGRTIRRRSRWADPSRRPRLSLIIDTDTCCVVALLTNGH